jgi:hypothetical protein
LDILFDRLSEQVSNLAVSVKSEKKVVLVVGGIIVTIIATVAAGIILGWF